MPAACLPPEYVYHVLDGNQDVAKMETAAVPEEPEAGSPDSEKSWEVLAGGQPCAFQSSVPPFACIPSSCISNQEDHAWPDEPHVSSHSMDGVLFCAGSLDGLWLIHDNYPSSIPLFYIVWDTLRNLT